MSKLEGAVTSYDQKTEQVNDKKSNDYLHGSIRVTIFRIAYNNRNSENISLQLSSTYFIFDFPEMFLGGFGQWRLFGGFGDNFKVFEEGVWKLFGRFL